MTHRAGCLWVAATKATADIDAIRFNMTPPSTPAMPLSMLGRVRRLRQVVVRYLPGFPRFHSGRMGNTLRIISGPGLNQWQCTHRL
jgi:hypothetical protein